MVEPSPGYLLDTNVIADLMKTRPDRNVVSWIDGIPEHCLHLSAITIGEIRKGIDLLDDTERRSALQLWLHRDVRERFAGRLLPFDDRVAERWGSIEAAAKRRRITLPTVDAQLAATAAAHDLILATRNTRDFASMNISLLNPWDIR
jgi:predicted nucleic acid-binding protein